MAELSRQLHRRPAVAGMFYPADAAECRALAARYTSERAPVEIETWIGGIVPHAGWVCSGALAGQTIAALARGQTPVRLIIVFGAVHTPLPLQQAVLDSYSSWDLPDGACLIQNELRSQLQYSQRDGLFLVDDRFHVREHAVEVELPLIRSVWPNIPIVPIEVPPLPLALEIGRTTAKLAAAMQRSRPGAGRVIFLASSDLTHYGPNYGFAPVGTGIAAMNWAKQNDRPLIDKILQLQEEQIIPEVQARLNACGAGAIAAMLAACKELGASRAKLLRHATSFETLANVAPQAPDNAVGYASIVVG